MNLPIDREAALARLVGDEELLEQVIDIFLADAQLELDALNDALAAEDAEAALRLAHSIKGAASNISALAVSDAALSIERAVSEGDFAEARSMAVNLSGNFQRLKSFVEHGEE